MIDALALLQARLSALPGVACARSRFGAGGRPAWRIGAREFAHLHSDTLLDLRLPKAVQAGLHGDPRAHFRAGRSQWVELEFRSEEDVTDLVVLAQQALAAARGDG
jgi:Family of unknown function (DUF5519)